jgi:cyclopropane-fatty-acyl-phospholipid synthase
MLTTVEMQEKKQQFVDELKTLPIAIAQTEANEQHYEVPDEFYQIVLGPYLKYSSGYWRSPGTTLEESEIAMLELYCERAQLEDGMVLVSKPNSVVFK